MTTRKPHIRIIEGTLSVLISAPHTRPIILQGPDGPFKKPREVRIGPLAKRLCRSTGAWGILMAGRRSTIANWQSYMLRKYKKMVKRLIAEQRIQLVIDIHGSESERPFSVDYDFKASRRYPFDSRTLENIILRRFEEVHFVDPVSKNFFSRQRGIGRHTLTYFIRRNFDIPAVQIEINQRMRRDPEEFQKLEKALYNIITDAEALLPRQSTVSDTTKRPTFVERS